MRWSVRPALLISLPVSLSLMGQWYDCDTTLFILQRPKRIQRPFLRMNRRGQPLPPPPPRLELPRLGACLEPLCSRLEPLRRAGSGCPAPFEESI
jgi:hypothetical protein